MLLIICLIVGLVSTRKEKEEEDQLKSEWSLEDSIRQATRNKQFFKEHYDMARREIQELEYLHLAKIQMLENERQFLLDKERYQNLVERFHKGN